MQKKTIHNLMLLAAAVLAFLLFSEAAARAAAKISPSFLCDTFSRPDDWYMCRLEFDLRKNINNKSQETLELDKSICDKWDPQLGWVTNTNCNSIRASTRYTTNSKGFRGQKEYKLEKDKTRIMVLGDSFTWGENNFDNETYPYYLDHMLNGTADVINMGVHGYGPDQFYLYFVREGIKYKPDIVVFGLFLPDIHRTAFRVRSFFKPRFIIMENKLVLDEESSKIPDLKAALEMSSDIKKRPRIYSLSFLAGTINKLARASSSYKTETATTLKIIDELDMQLRKYDSRLIVLLIPEQEMVEKGNTNYYGVVPKITEHLDEKGIAYINLQPVFKNETEARGESLYRGHLKPEGNLIIAREIYRHMGKT